MNKYFLRCLFFNDFAVQSKDDPAVQNFMFAAVQISEIFYCFVRISSMKYKNLSIYKIHLIIIYYIHTFLICCDYTFI